MNGKNAHAKSKINEKKMKQKTNKNLLINNEA